MSVLLILAGWQLNGLAADRLNVLFIAIDDLRPEAQHFGGSAITPNMDRLAKSGLQFDRAYCNQAVCGASRVSLMTGLYPEYTGERTYHVTDWRSRWAHITTLNQHFRANGYNTVGLGKVYHGSSGRGVDPENWSDWIPVRGTEYSNPESLQAKRKAKPDSKGRQRGPATESSTSLEDKHADSFRAATGADQIEKLAKDNAPFFLAVGFTKPHLPFVAPKRFWDLYARDDFQLPSNLGVPPNYPDYASNRNAGELRSYCDIPRTGLPSAFPLALNQRLLHGYHACVSYVDSNIGTLLKALEESQAADNTIVVLWADHGWKLGDHSSWCKHTNFECDNRIPLIIRHPRLASARGRTKALVELVDLYPTLCDVCGLEKPKHLQGQSLVKVLEDPNAAHREFAYSSYPHSRGKQRVVGHSIRTAKYRYTEWWQRDTDVVVDRVLTDIESDPGETTSINDMPELTQTLSESLRTKVLSVRKP